MSPLPPDWYTFADIRKRRLAKAVWVPLRAIETIRSEKKFGELGFVKETFACGSLAIPLDSRDAGDRLGWSEIGVGHEVGQYCGPEGYKAADEYWLDWEACVKGPKGVELVLPQGFGLGEQRVWHLNQDLVFALRLLKEGDVWVRAEEGLIEVARLARDDTGEPIRLEIRCEHLRDYLAARQMALRIALYRERDSIVADAQHISWREEGIAESADDFRFEARAYAVHDGSGHPYGSQSAVFRAWRTDVHEGEDVPEFGPENDSNVDHASSTFGDEGAKVYRVEGEIWAQEWIEPGKYSTRVRGDRVASTTSFIVDASGETQTADELDDQDIGKYLWFRPDVIPALLTQRGVGWTWYTRDTGGIQLSSGYSIHFGLNLSGLLNTHAYDIAKLPEWQRRMWQGFNVAPEGGVSPELLQSQMRADPARTMAPEAAFEPVMADLDAAFLARFAKPLFRSHAAKKDIAAQVHRFRALQPGGILALAKDVARLTADSFDLDSLHSIAPPRAGEAKGSLKSLERVLATFVPPELARALLTPLVGVYDLRLGDAHLPSSEIEDALTMIGIVGDERPLLQGLQLLQSAVVALVRMLEVVRSNQGPDQVCGDGKKRGTGTVT